MLLKNIAFIDHDTDRITIPKSVCLQMLDGLMPDDCTLIESFSDDTEMVNSGYLTVNRIFYFEGSAWWLVGLYSFDTKSYKVYDYDADCIVEDDGLVSLPGIEPKDGLRIN